MELGERKMINDRQVKWIIFILAVFNIAFRYIKGDFTKSYIIFGDELLYWNQAKSLASGNELSIRNMENSTNIILYQLLLSIPMVLFQTARLQIKAINLLNCMLVSSTVFWVYKIGKKIGLNNGFILISVLFTLTLPNMTLTMSYMTENLFFTIALAIFYMELKLLDIQEEKAVFKNCILLGIVFALAKATRDIALCLVAAYAAWEVLHSAYCILVKKNYKREEIKGYCIRFFIPLIVYMAFYKMIYAMIPNADVSGGMSGSSILTSVSRFFRSIESFLCLITLLFHNVTYSLVAMGFFPVLLPILCWKNIRQCIRKWYICVSISFISVLMISTLLTEVTIKVYQKERYIFYLIIPFIMIFFKLFQDAKEIYFSSHKKYIYTIFSVLAFFLFLLFLRYTDYGSQADHGLLEYLRVIGSRVGDRQYSWLGRSISKKDLAILILWIALVFGGYSLFFKRKRIFFAVITLFIFGTNLISNYSCIRMYQNGYSAPENEVQELEKLNEYIKNLEGNFLVIIEDSKLTSPASARLDTYVEKELYFAGKEKLQILKGEKGYVDLLEDSTAIHNSKSNYQYRHSFEADYIIVVGPYVKIEFAEEMETGLSQYTIYKNNNKNRIYFRDNSLFPATENETHIFTAKDKIFISHYIDENGECRSTDIKGHLFYGPYVAASSGVYQIKVNYEYGGQMEEGVIGNLDINMKGDYQYNHVEIYAQNTSGEMTVILNQDVLDAEIRLYTSVPGIRFESIEITRLSDAENIQ